MVYLHFLIDQMLIDQFFQGWNMQVAVQYFQDHLFIFSIEGYVYLVRRFFYEREYILNVGMVDLFVFHCQINRDYQQVVLRYNLVCSFNTVFMIFFEDGVCQKQGVKFKPISKVYSAKYDKSFFTNLFQCKSSSVFFCQLSIYGIIWLEIDDLRFLTQINVLFLIFLLWILRFSDEDDVSILVHRPLGNNYIWGLIFNFQNCLQLYNNNELCYIYNSRENNNPKSQYKEKYYHIIHQHCCLFMLLLYRLIQLMKNQDFQIKLLIKQNTQMSSKLQSYRRENQQLTKKNQNLNCWVQNLSEVFSSISAAWKIITNSQEALFTLMRKKSDSNSKALVGKYISHFKTFEEIITNLGDKITNEGHSQSATIDAKTRLASFVNNYHLFFIQFVQTFFKFNEEYLSFIKRMEQPNLQAFTKDLMEKQLGNRTKIKQFQSFFTQHKQNLKVYEAQNQHQLLDGIILEKMKEIQLLKDCNFKQARKIAYMTDYNSQNVSFVLQNEQAYECCCGGAQLQYYKKSWEENINKQGNGTKVQSSGMIEENNESLKLRIEEIQEFQIEKQLLLQRNVQTLSKLQKIKLQNRITDEAVLQSPIFLHLKTQFNDLMDYTNELIHRLNKNYHELNQLQKIRCQEIEELKQKYEKPLPSKPNIETIFTPDHKLITNFKSEIINQITDLKIAYDTLCQKNKQRCDNLAKNKDLMRGIRKENQDLNKKMNQIQERALKNIEPMEFRHAKFNQLSVKVSQMFLLQPHNEENDNLKKIWEQFVDYVKNRDKKIKNMEQVIRKKQKQLSSKMKIEEIMKNSLKETEQIYMQEKEKLNKFQKFMEKIERQIVNFTEQNYKMKLQLEQEKLMLQLRLKSELQVRARFEQKVKAIERIQQQVKVMKAREEEIEQKCQEYSKVERQKINKMKMDIKERQRENKQSQELLVEKDKNIDKLIEDKEKKNLEINKLRLKLKMNEQNAENEIVLMEMEDYKSKIMCRCGADREREIVLKTCSHFFCRKCIEDTTASRNRKCPICSIKFSKTDTQEIIWT